jgi:hypothetical protein
MDLGQLVALPLPERACWLSNNHGEPLTEALRLAASQGLPPGSVSEAGLADAVAYNLAPPPDGPARPGQTILGRHCGDGAVFEAQTPFVRLWEMLTRPRGQTMLLAELAWSLACERRADWAGPATAPPAWRSQRCLNALLKRCHPAVVGLLRSRYGGPLGEDELESCANLAWAQIYRACWSEQAGRRFLGLATITGLVLAVAARRAQEELRRAGQGPSGARVAQPARPGPLSLGDKLPPAGALGHFFRWHRREPELTACLLQLPPHQAVYSYCYHSSGLGQDLLANAFRCSRANISQVLLRAWEQLSSCTQLRSAFDEIAQTVWETGLDAVDLA